MNMFGTAVLIIRPDYYVLSVSRRHDYNDFGLPGGKVENGDGFKWNAMRELEEETGLFVLDAGCLDPVFASFAYAKDSPHPVFCQTFLASKVSGNFRTEKNGGRIAWCHPYQLTLGSFGEYNKKLFDAGNIPLTKFQEIEYKYQGAQADYLNAQIELDRVEAEYLDKISKAESELNNTQAELFDSQAELAKLKNEFANMQIRNAQYQIIAPQNGVVVKALKAGIGETIKEGEAVCSIMPQASDMAVEMYVRAMDVPLISKGRHVRIQFDGWPALQFSGWPSVSVGTFGGTVKVIDYINSQPGLFRILIIPDTKDETWPEQLRVGSGIKGWVMLDDVPVWYEIWRQLNGFPPSLYEENLQSIMKESKSSEKATEAEYEDEKK